MRTRILQILARTSGHIPRWRILHQIAPTSTLSEHRSLDAEILAELRALRALKVVTLDRAGYALASRCPAHQCVPTARCCGFAAQDGSQHPWPFECDARVVRRPGRCHAAA